jgi:hypothetical protein
MIISIRNYTLWERLKLWWERFTNWYNSPIYRWLFKKEIKNFEAYQMPLIKTLGDYLSLVDDLVKIQPMNEPGGQVFYLDFVRPKRKWYKFWRKNETKN